MSMAEYILKLRGHIKSKLRQKMDVRTIAYLIVNPKEPMTTWWPNPLDGDSDHVDEVEMMEAWNKAQERHDQRAEDKD